MAVEIAEGQNRLKPGVYTTAPIGEMREAGPVDHRWGAVDEHRVATWVPSEERPKNAVQVIRHDAAALSSQPYARDIARRHEGRPRRQRGDVARRNRGRPVDLDRGRRAEHGHRARAEADVRGRRSPRRTTSPSPSTRRRRHGQRTHPRGGEPPHRRQPPVRARARHAGRGLRRAAERSRARHGRARREHRRKPRHQRLRAGMGAARARAPVHGPARAAARPVAPRRAAHSHRHRRAVFWPPWPGREMERDAERRKDEGAGRCLRRRPRQARPAPRRVRRATRTQTRHHPRRPEPPTAPERPRIPDDFPTTNATAEADRCAERVAAPARRRAARRARVQQARASRCLHNRTRRPANGAGL